MTRPTVRQASAPLSQAATLLSPRKRLGRAFWLGAALPLCLPFGILLELLLLLLALLALRQLWLRRQDAALWQRLRPLWLPAGLLIAAGLLSAVDAVDAPRSLLWVLAAVAQVLAASHFLLQADRERCRGWMLGAAAAVALWTADAVLQALSGWSLGGPVEADRLSGVFGADDLKLGPVLALLAPFLLLPCLTADSRRWLLPVVFIALSSAILLAGARAAWLGYLVLLAALAWHAQRTRPLRLLVVASAAVLCLALLAVAGYHGSERFAARVDRTLAAFDGSREGIDHALAGRLPIFETAWRMGWAHPVNGVGVRGFRDAYPAHAAADDPWVSADGTRGAAHPHYWPLEVFAEQGGIGLLAWSLALALWWTRWRQAGAAQRALALPPALALLVLLFPLNTHPALYSSFWQALLWWNLGLLLAALQATEPCGAGQRRSAGAPS